MVPADGCEITVFGFNKRCSENRRLVLDIVQIFIELNLMKSNL